MTCYRESWERCWKWKVSWKIPAIFLVVLFLFCFCAVFYFFFYFFRCEMFFDVLLVSVRLSEDRWTTRTRSRINWTASVGREQERSVSAVRRLPTSTVSRPPCLPQSAEHALVRHGKLSSLRALYHLLLLAGWISHFAGRTYQRCQTDRTESFLQEWPFWLWAALTTDDVNPTG